MKLLPKTPLVAAILACSLVQAEPIVIDNNGYTIIVVRPLDEWSGNKSALQESLEAHQDKTVWFQVFLGPSTGFRGNPTLTQTKSDHPIGNAISAALKDLSFKQPRSSANSFTVFPPVSIPAESIQDFLKFQEYEFKRITLANGDPEKLQAKTTRNKIFGGVMALGVTALGVDKLGLANGASAILGSGITGDIYNLASKYKGGLAPVHTASIDPAKYTTVDARQVTVPTGDRAGQILIAYKSTKTDQAEAEALAEAVITLTGAKSTSEQITNARMKNFKARQAIWAKCKAQDLTECKE